MQNYDVTLKRLFRSSAQQTLAQLTGKVIEKWLPVELPQVQNLRMDLLGEAADGSLVQIELQSTNDLSIHKRSSSTAKPYTTCIIEFRSKSCCTSAGRRFACRMEYGRGGWPSNMM